MAETVHVFKSELGDNFTSFHNWCLDKCTPEELAVYEAGVINEAYTVLWEKWWIDQKILSHEIWEDGVKVAP